MKNGTIRWINGVRMLGFSKDAKGWWLELIQIKVGKKIVHSRLGRGASPPLTPEAQKAIEAKYDSLVKRKLERKSGNTKLKTYLKEGTKVLPEKAGGKDQRP